MFGTHLTTWGPSSTRTQGSRGFAGSLALKKLRHGSLFHSGSLETQEFYPYGTRGPGFTLPTLGLAEATDFMTSGCGFSHSMAKGPFLCPGDMGFAGLAHQSIRNAPDLAYLPGWGNHVLAAHPYPHQATSTLGAGPSAPTRCRAPSRCHSAN